MSRRDRLVRDLLFYPLARSEGADKAAKSNANANANKTTHKPVATQAPIHVSKKQPLTLLMIMGWVTEAKTYVLD